MRDFAVFFLVIYIFATSFFAAKYFSSPSQPGTFTSIKELVLPSYNHKIILKSGEEITAAHFLSTDRLITITSDTGLELTLPKEGVSEIVPIPSEHVDKRLFVLGTITKQPISSFKEVVFVSDALFPFWFAGIIWLSLKKKLFFWQGWLIASIFCLAQSFLATSFLGRTAGSVVMAGSNISTLLNHFTPQLSNIFFGSIQVFFVGLVPTTFFFTLSKIQMRKKLLNSASTPCPTNDS